MINTWISCYGGVDMGEVISKNNVSCKIFDSSQDEYCVTTSAIPLRVGKHLSLCDLVFPLLCSHAVIIPLFCLYGRNYGAHVALAQKRILRGS